MNVSGNRWMQVALNGPIWKSLGRFIFTSWRLVIDMMKWRDSAPKMGIWFSQLSHKSKGFTYHKIVISGKIKFFGDLTDPQARWTSERLTSKQKSHNFFEISKTIFWTCVNRINKVLCLCHECIRQLIKASLFVQVIQSDTHLTNKRAKHFSAKYC